MRAANLWPALLLLLPAALGLSVNTVNGKLKANSWQARLDKALLSVDLGTGSRFRLLQRALKDPALQADVLEAVDTIRTNGFAKGHPELIDTLWPTGTTARADLEGLTRLRKQVPEALNDLPEALQKLKAPPPSESSKPVDPSEVLNSLIALATSPKKQAEFREEAKDLFRSTPEGLETPRYSVERVLDGPLFLGKSEVVELRSYEQFTVARTSMSGSAGFGSGDGAAGFNTLAAYLFGKNEASEAMAMTMPVEVSGKGMAFVLPRQYADEPPAPLEGSEVTIDSVPVRLVAVKAFAGLVTDEEVARQTTALREALASDGSTTVVEGAEVSVLQYNSPLTIPWRRRNEVALVVSATTPPETEEGSRESEAAPAVEAMPDGVVSWFDAGMRL